MVTGRPTVRNLLPSGGSQRSFLDTINFQQLEDFNQIQITIISPIKLHVLQTFSVCRYYFHMDLF